MQRASSSIAIALFLQSAGCAAILGLDSGNEPGVDAGEDSATSEASVADSGKQADSAIAPQCAPDTADCNGNPNDGCETTLNTSQHCGSCTTACGLAQSCNASRCCGNDNTLCSADQDCCSGQCNGHKCGH